MKVKNEFVIREICGEKVLSGEGSDFVNFNKLIRLNDSAAYLFGICRLIGLYGGVACQPLVREV